jgi:hypothetical protein
MAMNAHGIRRALAALGPWWKRIIRTLAAALIAYLFVIVLITASLQAAITERLSELSPPIDYSTAHAIWRASYAVEQDLRAQRGRAAQLEEAVQLGQRIRATANDELYGRIGELRMVLRRVTSRTPCDAATGAAPQSAEEEATQVAATIALLRQCAADPAVPKTAKEEAEKFLSSGAPELLMAAQNWLSADRTLRQHEAQLEKDIASSRPIEARLSSLQAARTAFSDLGGLQRIWLRPASVVAELPPVVVQIVLAFVSGLFGALLVTLVLIVYPKTEIELTSDKARFGARILLGGLISLCVFVVLGGGTAVLGSDNGFAAGDANYLAFCAIGILAGMFSDRVADWLSDRANAFFRDSADRTSGAGPIRQPGDAPPAIDG